jgi:hypothetical protein
MCHRAHRVLNQLCGYSILEVIKLPDKPLGYENGDEDKNEDNWNGLLNSQ